MCKTKKRLLLLFLVISSTSYGQQTKNEVEQFHFPWIKFIWEADYVGNKYFDKTSISIPIKIQGLPYKFKAQFDLGALTTMFYGNTISTYSDLFPTLIKETRDTLAFKEGRFKGFKNINLYLDNVLFSNITVMKMPNFGDSLSLDSAKSSTIKAIGTIGGDLVENKILMIDYPNQRICIIDSLPPFLMKKIDFINAKFSPTGRVKIPFRIGKNEIYLMFDTGSSIFPIVTCNANAASITDENAPITDSITISSWGKTYYVYQKKIKGEMYLGNRIIHNNLVYYSDKVTSKKHCDENQILGYTGNVLFLDKVLIIDYKNKRFGVLQNVSNW
jgi:hypothetical protein